MSGRVATTGAGGLRSDPGKPQTQRRPAWATPVNLVILGITVLALAIRVYYQYTRPGFLLSVTEYDDGPYFGSAIRLVHGSLPYRDFVLVQPPGITLLMSPAALLSNLTGTAWGMAVGRVLTALASTAGVALVGLLVRHRGLLTVVIACGIAAVYPDAVAAAHTVLVEPWLALACLIGAVTIFSGDRLAASTRRLAWGGVAFGFAGAVEAWAIVPVLVVFVLCLPQIRRAAVFTAGVAAGFLIPVLPFAAIAPEKFYQSLIVAQIGSRAHATRVTLFNRLDHMAGVFDLNLANTALVLAALAIVAFVVLAYAFAWYRTSQPPAPLDWFSVATAGLVAALFLWPPQFHYHFAAFLAPFLALSVALAAGRLLAAVQAQAGSPAAAARMGQWSLGAAAALLAVMTIIQSHAQTIVPPVLGPVPAAIDQIIPRGACVLTDQVSLTINADRFVSAAPGCPQMVDTLGTDLALSHGLTPGTGAARVPAVAAVWSEAFGHAQYVLLTRINTRRIPWSPSLRKYLRSHFRRVYTSPRDLTLYVRKGQPAR
ncbi:MAG TPA: glycosyltransferase family 87 protein [Streptosporangiaceae bacterium]